MVTHIICLVFFGGGGVGLREGGGGVNKVHYGLCLQIDWKEMIKMTHKVIYKPKGGLTGSMHIL